MDDEALRDWLTDVNHSRLQRAKRARTVLEKPGLIGPLLQIGIGKNKALAARAIWVVEYAVKQNPALLMPHLPLLLKNAGQVEDQKVIRPLAKMIEVLLNLDYNQQGSSMIPAEEKEQLAALCFDWLIGNHKVAAKVHSMSSLYFLGYDFSWIHRELALILKQHYGKGSAAYKARARKVLSRLNQ